MRWTFALVLVVGFGTAAKAAPNDDGVIAESDKLENIDSARDISRSDARKLCLRLPVEATDLSQVVCYDYVDREPVRISEKGRTANDNIVILPNRQTVVRVIREVGADVTIGLGGGLPARPSSSSIARSSRPPARVASRRPSRSIQR